ncbi:GFA family protein [Erythrobacter sp. EC-HK427]|uniref:GFA family protein n=1 Tax=Erythrobacter sp. EC-HK427 TaxID=2038396 RepID=UPI001254A089|nr:GFA family protein [Erythrobacter sp. EC-HK427]VVT13000.1 Aldehyde-activating protein [Erythrobacter sp. EC-HK427]
MPKRHASCQCGALTAEIADGAEAATVVCHCIDCQRRSGSPFGAIAYYPKDKVTLAGEATEFTRPTDEGRTFTTGFCPACGSTVWARADKHPTMIGVPLGAFADPLFGKPARSVYERSKHYWVALPANVPRHPMGRNT